MINDNLESILAGFTKTANRLEKYIARMDKEAAAAGKQADLALDRKSVAEAESSRADKIRAKIADLISA